MNIAHLPTLMLVVGYPLYWVEMYFRNNRDGITSPVAASLFLFFVFWILWRERQTLRAVVGDFYQWITKLSGFNRWAAWIVLSLIAVIMMCVLYASHFPPHLMQESDAMNYHYSLARQHLIMGSFQWISWSAFDLFLLPIDFALAPFWFVTPLPNKIPQVIFFVGLVLMVLSLARKLAGSSQRETGSLIGFLSVALLFGSHGFGIQMGTAMLDLVNVYLFFAAIDSFYRRAHMLFIMETNFYIWSKPLIPLQVLVVALGVIAIIMLFRRHEVLLDFQTRVGQKSFEDGLKFLRQCAVGFLIVAAALAGPFMVKSLYYAGTPLYPLGLGLLKSHSVSQSTPEWEMLKKFSDRTMISSRSDYGYGHSFLDFVKQFWLVAVPEKGVNNAFDYPLGLSYLIVLGPFVYLLARAFFLKQLPLLPVLVVVFWVVWFFGSQQSRWLFIPVLLMFLLTAKEFMRPSKILWIVLIMALLSNAVSIIRSHKHDFGKSRLTVLREQDRALYDASKSYLKENNSAPLAWHDPEVAFAQCPVRYTPVDSY